MSSRLGIIDLGTNTFHLLIVEKNGENIATLFHKSQPTQIGLGGINKKLITDEATERALKVLHFFREQLDIFGVSKENTFAFGTSAIRNAENRDLFCEKILKETGITITVIDGNQEAEYIYNGVRTGVNLGKEPSLIMDIGGGSVEFIIGNEKQIFWKQSFEIGGQRLMEKFMKNDPISESDKKRLYNYFDENLIPLANAVHQYAPVKLVGSSGTFDTLVDIDYQYRTGEWPSRTQTDFVISLDEFYRAYALILSGNHDERMAIPGMIALRVDMIVVAVCLVDYVLKSHKISKIQVSSHALKEGVLAKLLDL
ncbi:exopolyphosphatase / guanosine-5'-triphosphate,3'-diphosphate pyrophosphatase [Dyadobacter koreensis]|uniref:Exopolyphosphatase / guanosine-5'-triphosphate,3'-diphosphate pyrophosphatase n=1 Tax=Dyadobacter koreensis TaxID=408657 RepID=A0A1H6W3N8_9BACT|nr:phosphatase [Dyadobacter koreensis]SEJ11558.1 exopolyphosphatase / guanosine-5'-triphosphate,3'-diphosphate pyrophosphatase [Dyadobacter koreensis]